MISLILTFIVAVAFGSLGYVFVSNNIPGGILGSICTGFIGSWIGYLFLGAWGPTLAGFAIVPALIGAGLFVLMLGMLSKLLGQPTSAD